MTNLVFTHNRQSVTTSLLVSETFYKEHKSVLRDINTLECSENFFELNFELNSYKSLTGIELPMYYITRDGFTFLAMGYTGEKTAQLKEAYINQFNIMENTLRKSALPDFERRYYDNWHKIPIGYFSIITEMFPRVYKLFERLGYVIPERSKKDRAIRMDISVGLLFSQYLTEKYKNRANLFSYYTHTFPDGTSVQARMYPDWLLGELATFINLQWLPFHAEKYFKERDIKALKYLPKLLKAG